MRIERLSVKNYRNLGDREIKFPKNSEHDITTITLQNPDETTNLAKAILWTLSGNDIILYGDNTLHVFNDKSVNNQRREHTATEASVDLRVNDSTLTATRRAEYEYVSHHAGWVEVDETSSLTNSDGDPVEDSALDFSDDWFMLPDHINIESGSHILEGYPERQNIFREYVNNLSGNDDTQLADARIRLLESTNKILNTLLDPEHSGLHLVYEGSRISLHLDGEKFNTRKLSKREKWGFTYSLILAYWSLQNPHKPSILDEPYTGDPVFDSKLEATLINLSSDRQVIILTSGENMYAPIDRRSTTRLVGIM